MFNVTSTLGPISAILCPASLSPHPIFCCPWLLNSFLRREVLDLWGAWLSFLPTLAMVAALSPASCILIYQTNSLWSLYMSEMEEHTGVFGASADQLQIHWEVNAQGCCQSLGIAGFLHCPNRVYHVADTASHVTRRSNCTLVSENIVRALLYLRHRVPTLCSQTSSGGAFPVNGTYDIALASWDSSEG